MKKTFIVIGLSDAQEPWLDPKALDAISKAKVFSGGKRHHEIMKGLLPNDYKWIDITVPLAKVFEQYRETFNSQFIVVFASGDPLFFGFANTILREMPDAEIQLFPSFNSLQTLAHRIRSSLA